MILIVSKNVFIHKYQGNKTAIVYLDICLQTHWFWWGLYKIRMYSSYVIIL